MKFFRAKIELMLLSIATIILGSVGANYKLGYFDHWETDQYVHFYLSPGSFISKIFDNRYTDIATNFRGREFANIFNFLDAQAILISADLGFVHFLSLTHILSLVLISILFISMVIRYYDTIVRLPLLLMLCIFLTSPAPFMTGHYFRTSKILISLGIIIMTFCYHVIIKKYGEKKLIELPVPSIGTFVCTFLFGSILGTTDELGIATIGIFIFLGTLTLLRRRQFILIPILLGLVSSYIFIYAYREVFGPYIIYHTTGNVPDLWTIDTSKQWDVNNYKQSLEFFLSAYIGNFFGGIPSVVSALLVVGSALVLLISIPYDHYKRLSYGGYWLNLPIQIVTSSFVQLTGVFFLLTIVIHLMTGTQGVFLTANFPQLRLIYYPLPFATFFLLGGMATVSRIIKILPNARMLVVCILAVLVLLNIARLQKHYTELASAFTTNGAIISAFPIINAVQAPVLSAEDLMKLNGGQSTVIILRDRMGK